MTAIGHSNLKSKAALKSIKLAAKMRRAGIKYEIVEEVVVDTTQISSMQAQLVVAQSALTTAQAQTVASAVTIASLGAQVSALQAQISALSTLKTYFVGAVTEVGGGIYVPPSYDNAVIFTEHVQPPRIVKQVTTVGGAFP